MDYPQEYGGEGVLIRFGILTVLVIHTFPIFYLKKNKKYIAFVNKGFYLARRGLFDFWHRFDKALTHFLNIFFKISKETAILSTKSPDPTIKWSHVATYLPRSWLRNFPETTP